MRKLLICMVGFVLMSCGDFFEQDVDVDIPDHDPKLVMYSYAAPGDSLIILLTTSVGVEVPANLWEMWMSNAAIDLVKNGTAEIPVSVNTADEYFPYFVAITELEPKDHLSITVSSEGYQSISSEVVIPATPQAADAMYEGRRINIEGEELAAFNFKITDEKEVKNYYEVSIVAVGDDGLGNTFEFITATYYDSNLPWINPPSEDGFNLRLFFDDVAFADGEITVEFLADVWELANPEFYSPEFGNEYYLSLKSVTKEYYDFVRAFGIHQDNQYPDLFSGEPVPMPTNINNGFGVFGAYSEARIKIDLGDLED